MHSVDGWTGESAGALQAALRQSNEGFAAHLGVAVRTVAAWHQKPGVRPRPEMQQLLDTALSRADDEVRERFARLTGPPPDRPADEITEPRLNGADPHVSAALEWLDRHSGHPPGWSRRAVAEELGHVELNGLRDRAAHRGRIRQRDLAHALVGYYGPAPGYGRYAATFGAERIETSILTRPGWLDLDCPLTPRHDRFRVVKGDPTDALSLDDAAAHAAVRRLAEALTAQTRMVNSPIFQLADAQVEKGVIGGALSVTEFVRYALTMDLLEAELTDAVAAGASTAPGSLPLRDLYLPDVGAVLGLADRLCAGGVLALLAIARPADPYRGDADYLILVQERSGQVLNAARRLAVIPKGFHQPLTDVRADAQVGASLRREMEEELFGRGDLDNTLDDIRHADPMHPTRLSEPMRYLLAEPARLHMECTAFGLNLVSGNYEFASLIVIQDEDFWARYGGAVEANWESSVLRRYSSTDEELVTELMTDEAWSNEGLFAMTQGLHRLAEIGGSRIQLPPITWEIA